MSENQYQPDVVSPPGETLREWISGHDMSYETLAAWLLCSLDDIHRIFTGELRISQDLSQRLYIVTNIPYSFWIKSERRYRAYLDQVRAAQVAEIPRIGEEVCESLRAFGEACAKLQAVSDPGSASE